MKKDTLKKLLLYFVVLVNAALLSIPFVLLFDMYANAEILVSNYAVCICFIAALFMGLLYCFGRIYDAFSISASKKSELIYSQVLSLFVTDVIMFLIIWIVFGSVPPLLAIVVCIIMQIMLASAWCICAQAFYRRIRTAEKTAIIYDTDKNIANLIKQKHLDGTYDIVMNVHVIDCIHDLSVLDDMKIVFIAGVHSKKRNIIMKYCLMHGIDVNVEPRLGDILMSGYEQKHFFHFPVWHVRRYPASLFYLFVKRTFDIVASLTALFLLSPIMLVVAIAIKAYDGGPVIYSQVRLTKDAKKFKIYKFRSMRTDAEKDGVARLSTGNADDRITPVGRFIRKCRLDELPQLINILKGDLSIVGPRPERPEIAAQYEKTMPEFGMRLFAKAGLTGYAQVYGQYNTAPYDKLQMDLMYIAHPSLFEDFKIIMATIKILFMSESTEGVAKGQVTAAKD